MKFEHTMIRVLNLDTAIDFFKILGLKEVKRHEVPQGRYTLVFMAVEKGEPAIELTWNWDQKEPYTNGRNFGHLAFRVADIYETCQKIMDAGIPLLRPPRDGYMAFIQTPDNISIEFLQDGTPLPPAEPWLSMKNQGEW